ncbi:MAG: protein-glutamate O-methyltransferase CheR [bacterium]
MHEISATLKASEFKELSRLMHSVSGVKLTAGKESLMQSRLSPRLRALRLGSYGEYLTHIGNDSTQAELTRFVDLLTTNKTDFFREVRHFEYLRTKVLPRLRERGGVARFWSAACSSGEEPYSLAMLIAEEWNGANTPCARILATDLSTRMLAKATAAVYDDVVVKGLTTSRISRHMENVAATDTSQFRVRKSLRAMVQVAQLNLVKNDWPMTGPFDVIMCRNVMIYFDVATQERLINRCWDLLAPGGTLLVGHSESLTRLRHSFSYVVPATYVR